MVAWASSQHSGWIKKLKDGEFHIFESRSYRTQILYSITSASLYLTQDKLGFKEMRNGLHFAMRGVTKNL